MNSIWSEKRTATIQRALDIIISGVRWKMYQVHLNYVIIFSPSIDAHVGHVEKVLELIQRAGVTFKPIYCSLFRNEVD